MIGHVRAPAERKTIDRQMAEQRSAGVEYFLRDTAQYTIRMNELLGFTELEWDMPEAGDWNHQPRSECRGANWHRSGPEAGMVLH